MVGGEIEATGGALLLQAKEKKRAADSVLRFGRI